MDPLSDSEIEVFQRWVAQGARMAADGPDISRVFVLPLPVDRMKHVRGIEFRANNPRIHHANIRIDPTPVSRLLDEQDPAPGYDGIIVRSAVSRRTAISSSSSIWYRAENPS